ncbi:MAG: DNA cytosine methyltransferase [Bryobacterales bacterium]|nr:DNA cytosine methyltransferase [Bryobacterales bacterium]
MPAFYEFFSGGGLARAGLGENWECLFANDIDTKKGASYAANWGSERLKIEDVGRLATPDLPGRADLAWASFPCQDLSLAGDYAGLKGERSGTFWPFWGIIEALAEEGRAPTVVVLENVCGALTSHGGKDFAAIGAALAGGGYRFGALVVDAVRFVPQSRPRLFVVAMRQDRAVPAVLALPRAGLPWHPANLVCAYGELSERSKAAWVWWSLPPPPDRKLRFADVIEDEPQGVSWHTAAETQRLIGLMSPVNRKKVEQAMRIGRRMVGGVYKRTRKDACGTRVQRAEVRFDGVSGCLRTPVGGSSRQAIMIVEGDKVRSRLLAPREAARLMGLPDTYKLPQNYNEAYHLAGDGVVVPVVRFLAAHLLEPLLGEGTGSATKEAA